MESKTAGFSSESDAFAPYGLGHVNDNGGSRETPSKGIKTGLFRVVTWLKPRHRGTWLHNTTKTVVMSWRNPSGCIGLRTSR